jgi:hypothetical protein
MVIDHDAQLIIFGAVIGLVSSLVTALFQDWLARRSENKRKVEEHTQSLRQIQVATLSDIQKFDEKIGRPLSQNSPQASVNSARSPAIVIPILFVLFLLFLGLLTLTAILVNGPIIKAVIVGAIIFFLFSLLFRIFRKSRF